MTRIQLELALNKEIIHDCISAVTEAYKSSQNSSYAKISNSVFWSFSHGSITKFEWSFLAYSLQAMEPIIASKCLLQFTGDHTTLDCLFSVKANHIKI